MPEEAEVSNNSPQSFPQSAKPEKYRPVPPIKGRFKKGQSGNPGGMSKAVRDLRRNFTAEEAQEVRAALMEGVRDRVWPVVTYVHQHIYGKPKERLEVTVGMDEELRVVATTNLLARVRELRLKEAALKPTVVDALPSVVDSANE